MSSRMRLVALAASCSVVVFTAVSALAAGPPTHAAITITKDADFLSCGCVTGGAGTASDPYVIGPWTVSAPTKGGWALKVDNSGGGVTKFFNVAGITANYDDLDATHPVVWLLKVTQQTTVANVIANLAGIGVKLDSSANITLDGISVNKMNGDGVQVNASSNVSIVNSKLKSMNNGFHTENSAFIYIGANCRGTKACNEFTYDDFRGLWLHNTHDVVVNLLTTAAEDTNAMYLDGTGTYNVEIKNSTANASGSICPQAEGPTGLITDTDGGIRLVNGTHNNYIHDVTAHGNVAMDIASGGDGFWVNPCNGQVVPISPATAPMGSGNVFANLCYSLTNIPDLPPSTCKN